MTGTPLPLHPSQSPYITRAIDNTALAAYMECPRKYYYSMVENWRREGKQKPALAYGTTWHKILETHYKTGGDRDLVRTVAELSWQEVENSEDYRTLHRALAAYDEYLLRYGSFEKEQQGWGRTVGFPDAPMVEIATELSWPGALHPYTGKIDRIYEQQGLFFVEDHKTTSALGVHYFSQFDPSNQMMGYAWLASLISGLPIAGVRINAHGVLKTQNKFERQVVSFSPERLTEWSRNLNSWIKRLDASHRLLREAVVNEVLTEEVLLEAFPHNFNACAAKYGQCSYTSVCTMPARLRSRILAADFTQTPWNPLAGDEENVPE